MNYIQFLISQIPMCRKNPLQAFLEENQTRAIELSNRSVRDFNEDFFEKNCEHKLLCGATMCECVGRIIPKYPEIDHIMQDMKKEWNQYKSIDRPNLIRVEEVKYKDKDVWKLNIVTCKACNFKGQCNELCLTVGDNINRIEGCEDILGEVDEQKTGLLHTGSEEYIHNKLDLGAYDMVEPITDKTRSDIPLHKLTEKQRQIVILRDLNWKDWDEIARETGIPMDNCIQYHKKAIKSLKRLVKIAQNSKNNDNIYVKEYLNGMNMIEISKKYNVPYKTVQSAIYRIWAKEQ